MKLIEMSNMLKSLHERSLSYSSSMVNSNLIVEDNMSKAGIVEHRQRQAGKAIDALGVDQEP